MEVTFTLDGTRVSSLFDLKLQVLCRDASD